MKISKGKSTWGRAQESPTCRISSYRLPVEPWTIIASDYDVWQYILSIANQGSSPELWCPEFLLGFGHVDMADCDQPSADFSLQSLQKLS